MRRFDTEPRSASVTYSCRQNVSMSKYSTFVAPLILAAGLISNVRAGVTLHAGDRVVMTFLQPEYVATFRVLPDQDPGSLSSLFLDVSADSFGAGDVVHAAIHRGPYAPNPLQPAWMSLSPSWTDPHLDLGGSRRYQTVQWGENVHEGWLELHLSAGSIEVESLLFEYLLSDAGYPRGANPGHPLDYNLYRVSLTQVPEPGSFGMLGIALTLGSALGVRRFKARLT